MIDDWAAICFSQPLSENKDQESAPNDESHSTNTTYEFDSWASKHIEWFCRKSGAVHKDFVRVPPARKKHVQMTLACFVGLCDLDGRAALPMSPAFRKMLFERGQRLVAGCSAHIGAKNIQPLLVRLNALEKLAVKWNAIPR